MLLKEKIARTLPPNKTTEKVCYNMKMGWDYDRELYFTGDVT